MLFQGSCFNACLVLNSTLIISFTTFDRVWIWPCSLMKRLHVTSPRLILFFFSKAAKFMHSFFQIFMQISMARSPHAHRISGIWNSACWVLCLRISLVHVNNTFDPGVLPVGSLLPACLLPSLASWINSGFGACCVWAACWVAMLELPMPFDCDFTSILSLLPPSYLWMYSSVVHKSNNFMS